MLRFKQRLIKRRWCFETEAILAMRAYATATGSGWNDKDEEYCRYVRNVLQMGRFTATRVYQAHYDAGDIRNAHLA
jgi:hypothetical protein